MIVIYGIILSGLRAGPFEISHLYVLVRILSLLSRKKFPTYEKILVHSIVLALLGFHSSTYWFAFSGRFWSKVNNGKSKIFDLEDF